MLYEIKINEFGKKYTIIPKEGTEDNWRDIISWYSHGNNCVDEFNTIGLIVEPGEVPEFKVGEKAYAGFTAYADWMTLDKIEERNLLDNLRKLVKLYPSGDVKRPVLKEAAYKYFIKRGIMTEADAPLLRATTDMGFVLDYIEMLPDEEKALKYVQYWREFGE